MVKVIQPHNLGNEFDINEQAKTINVKIDGTTIVKSAEGVLSSTCCEPRPIRGVGYRLSVPAGHADAYYISTPDWLVGKAGMISASMVTEFSVPFDVRPYTDPISLPALPQQILIHPQEGTHFLIFEDPLIVGDLQVINAHLEPAQGGG